MRLFDTRALWIATALFAVAGGAAAQSVTSISGLGYPIAQSDARAESLDGIGVAVKGLAVPFTNPASVARATRRGVVVSAVATEWDSSLGDLSGSSGATRFPLIRVIFPMRGVVLTGGYGAFLDQAWSVEREGTHTLSTGPVTFRDQFTSVGGVGQARLGAAIPLGDRWAVGVSIGMYTGRQDLGLTRRYDNDSASIGTLQAYSETRAVQYSGTVAQVGVQWDPAEVVRVGGSVTWSGTLTADSTVGQVTTREYDLPLQVAAGASAYLAPSLLASVSGRWSGWGGTDPSGGLMETRGTVSSRDTWELGAGLELDDPERRTLYSFPLRAGFQYRQLPFTFVGDNAPTEWLASVGAGLRMGADFNTPVARIDLTVQRGARTASGSGSTPDLEETLWRFVLGVSIFGT